MNDMTTFPVAALRLPAPISVNSLYANVRGKGRTKTGRYNTWIWHVTAMLADQKPLPKVSGPVNIVFRVGEVGVSPKMDGDNTLKAYIDALVNAGVVADDNRKIIRSVGMEWVEGAEGATAHISHATPT